MILVVQDPNNRYAIKRKNRTWMVVDYSADLRIMDLHNEVKAFDFTIKDDSVAEEQNYNARYIFVRDQEAEHSLIPLLPGYVIFTIAGKKRFRLLILENNNQLLFFWEEFGSDSLYTEKKVQGVERLVFHYMLKKYGLDSNTCLRSILSLCEPQIIIKLKQLIHEKFPLRYSTIFQ